MHSHVNGRAVHGPYTAVYTARYRPCSWPVHGLVHGRTRYAFTARHYG